MLAFGLYVNVIIGGLNLLPIPPLDGGMVLIGLLPEKRAALVARLEPFGYVFFVMIAYYTGFWRTILAPAVYFVASFFAGDQIATLEQIIVFPLSN